MMNHEPTDIRLIRTKQRTYRIPRDEQGVAVEEYFKHVPESVRGARVFETEDGAIIAYLDEGEG